MIELPLVEFVGSGASLRLALKGRPFEDSSDAWDRDVIDVSVAAYAKPFSGEFDSSIWAHELVNLRSVLTEVDRHIGVPTALQFEFREAMVRLVFETDEIGAVTIHVTACESPSSRTRLVFEIPADQSLVATWLATVDHALALFPPQL